MDPVKPGEGQRETPLTGAHIGKSVIIKGELSGSENLYVDGHVEGSIELNGHSLTIGPNGRVNANLKAKDIVVQGQVDGSVNASDRLELRKTAVLAGDILAKRLSVEDGASLKGKIETTRSEPQAASQSQPQPQAKPAAVVASAGVAASGAAPQTSGPK